MTVRLVLLLVLSLALGGCNGRQVQSQQSLVMGTLATITVYAPQNTQTQKAIADAFSTLDQLHQRWHPWQHGATLAGFNQALQGGNWVAVPKALQPLLQQAIALHHKSQGHFDPGLGKITALWGFREAPEPGITRQPPAPGAVNALLQQGVGLDHLQLRQDAQQGLMARAESPALLLDFGAIAKGYAADLVTAQLARYGIHDAIVNLGGNLRVVGRKGEEAWRIGIRDPRGPGTIAAVRVQQDSSVISSGDYERYFIHQGRRYHHIFDPTSGYPAKGLISVTVITPSAALGDAASTALFVAGPKRWPQVARALGVNKVMAISENGEIWLTPAMQALVELSPGVASRVKIQKL